MALKSLETMPAVSSGTAADCGTTDSSGEFDAPRSSETTALREAQSSANESLLFIDDEPRVLDGYRRLLTPFASKWNRYYLSDSRQAMTAIRDRRIDVVVTDQTMPMMTGLEIIEELQDCVDTKHIPVIVVTGRDDKALKRQALNLGATELLNKPVELEELLARIRSALRLKASYDELNSQKLELERRVQDRTRDLQQSRQEIIARLGKACECRDGETGRHVIRVAHYSRLIAQEMKLPSDEVDVIFAAAPLHDIGKIAIPDSILLKKGRLTDEERRIMQSHCTVGAHILSETFEKSFEARNGAAPTASHCPLNDPVLRAARQIAATHHEHWDGRGYPNGLKGPLIPLAGRIVALADVFDALTTDRSYKPAFLLPESLRIIAKGVGSQFDPVVHQAFLVAMPAIEAVRRRLRDVITIDSSSSPADPASPVAPVRPMPHSCHSTVSDEEGNLIQ